MKPPLAASARQTSASPHPATRVRLAALVAAAIFLTVIGSAQEKPASPATRNLAKPAENKPAEYIGSEMCGSCHEDIAKAFAKNPHHVVETDKKRGFDTKACESCHGPGSNHMESMSAADIHNPPKQSGRSRPACLNCHLNQPTHAGRLKAVTPTTSHLRLVPLDSQERSQWTGAAKAYRYQQSLRRLPPGRLGQFPETL